VLQSFLREVKFMCTLDHPNICDCHGAVTRQEGDLLMWIVMEKLDMNLHTAIMGGTCSMAASPLDRLLKCWRVSWAP